MPGTAIVTNAVCDLTPQRAAELGVTMIPECIAFDGVPAFSNIDFDPPELYCRLRSSKNLPTGSHANISMYEDAFRSCSDASDIVCVNMTGRMSGSFNTGCIAADMLAEEGFGPRIYMFDSLELSHGLGFLVEEAAAMAAAGSTGAEIVARLEELRSRIGIYFVMRSLENARKGGRIGAIKCVLADSLNVKPVLVFRDGMVSDVAVTRGFDTAVKRLAAYYNQRAKKGGKVTVFHADNTADAEKLRAMVLERDPEASVAVEWLGCGIGIYTGEGCVGITFWE